MAAARETVEELLYAKYKLAAGQMSKSILIHLPCLLGENNCKFIGLKIKNLSG